ncbi:hypothetical protein OE88DRAFT_612322 [Heliocybe sulcata]|uniref:Uncharacterized protein n=1 Tax=Heliocybe sulcata TaxID=5364 RepID=A0A5C3NDF0_9AGAM|nr:hypothetical protein OE88DRAFT_612322 [Heliocybe sulcata]
MDYYDNSDILAPSARPVLRPSSSRSLAPSFWTLFRLAFFATLGTIAYYAFLHYKVHFNAWRERSHRLSMRRRYGIPDDDDRPFNVAFAAAHQARLAQSAKGPTPEARQGSQENFVPVRSGSLDGNGLRQRLNGNDRMSTPQLQSNHNHAAESAINQRNALLNNAPRNVFVLFRHVYCL